MAATFDYAEMLTVADDLIEFFGQPGVALVPGSQSGDAFNPTIAAATSLPITLAEVDFQEREIDGTTVLRGDKQLVVKADAPALIPSATQIVYGGVTHQVIGLVNPINPGGTLLLYIVHVRT